MVIGVEPGGIELVTDRTPVALSYSEKFVVLDSEPVFPP